MPKVGSVFNIFQNSLSFINYDLFYIFATNFMRFDQLAVSLHTDRIYELRRPKNG